MFRTSVHYPLSNIPLIYSDWYHIHGSVGIKHCIINVVYVANGIYVLTLNDVVYYLCFFHHFIYGMYSHSFLSSCFYLCTFMQMILWLRSISDRYWFVEDGIVALFSVFCFYFVFSSDLSWLLILFQSFL